MTKRIRVENADGSNYKVVVQIWDKRLDGQPDQLVEEIKLDHPTSQTGSDGLREALIHSTRYLIVKEA